MNRVNTLPSTVPTRERITASLVLDVMKARRQEVGRKMVDRWHEKPRFYNAILSSFESINLKRQSEYDHSISKERLRFRHERDVLLFLNSRYSLPRDSLWLCVRTVPTTLYLVSVTFDYTSFLAQNRKKEREREGERFENAWPVERTVNNAWKIKGET